MKSNVPGVVALTQKNILGENYTPELADVVILKTMNEYEGSLIVVEGIDGSGSTTLVENLKGELDDGYTYTQEPSQSVYGRLMREELQSDNDPTLSDFFLFMADRYNHVHSLIGPKLDDGENVITDRYSMSTKAYQYPIIDGEVDSFQHPELFINAVTDDWVIEPDLTIYIDVPVEVSHERKRDDEDEKYEDNERLRAVRQRYKDFVERRDYAVEIDGTQSEEDVLKEALEHISHL